MSTREGAVTPDALIKQYGSDVFRMYLGFGFSYVNGGPWDDESIKSIVRFTAKAGKILDSFAALGEDEGPVNIKTNSDLEYIRHFTIKQVIRDIEAFSFNTAIARIMEYVNAIQKHQSQNDRKARYEKSLIEDLILLLAPLAPHLSEEMWAYIGNDYSVHNHSLPVYDEAKLFRSTLKIAVQVNGSLAFADQ